MSDMVDTAKAPRYLNSGDGGLTVEYGVGIDERVNRAVVALGEALEARNLPGVRELIPTYRSLLVLFDPVVLPRRALIAAIEALPPLQQAASSRRRRWRVPVLYGGAHGQDLEAVAKLHGLSEDQVVALHSGADYRVYMIGFAPGFAYLGGLPEAIHTGRRTDPRLKTPPRSISIGGKQAAISPPLEIPSGWHLLGQTPVRSYDPKRADRPFLFEPGDIIRFEPMQEADYAPLCAAVDAGKLVAVQESAHEESADA